LALPIWTWAVYGGARVEWRGREFWVGMDMKVHELKKNKSGERNLDGLYGGPGSRSSSRDKDRVD
jgi:ceramide glucosyltransferase